MYLLQGRKENDFGEQAMCMGICLYFLDKLHTQNYMLFLQKITRDKCVFSLHTPTLRVRRVRGRQASRMARHRQLQGVFISISTSKWWKQTFQGRPNDSKPCEKRKKKTYISLPAFWSIYIKHHIISHEKNRYNMLQPWIHLGGV